MMLVSRITQPQNKPGSALRNDGTFNVSRTLTYKHQAYTIFATFSCNAADRSLCSGIFRFSSIWNISMRFLADQHNRISFSFCTGLVKLVLEQQSGQHCRQRPGYLVRQP